MSRKKEETVIEVIVVFTILNSVSFCSNDTGYWFLQLAELFPLSELKIAYCNKRTRFTSKHVSWLYCQERETIITGKGTE